MTAASLRVALCQTTSGTELDANLARAAALVREAAAQGADLIALPENVALMSRDRAHAFEVARPEAEHPAVPQFAALAAETGAWLLAGSIAVTVPGDGRLANRSLLFRPDGTLAARYDKIHMFDFRGATGEVHQESATFRPGEAAVLAETPWGGLGMTVCYDLRFPHLYRALAQAGARLLAVPSAFTVPTGSAHWHVLLRARAIETGCFVLAPAQAGRHANGRETFGHSLVVAPWGEVIAERPTGEGVLLAELDLAAIDRARSQVRSLSHDRPYAPPSPLGVPARDSAREPVA